MFTCDLTVENNFKKRNSSPKKCISLPMLNVVHTEYKLHVWIMANVSICSQISSAHRAMDFRCFYGCTCDVLNTSVYMY